MNFDRDGDGAHRPEDCDDTNASIRPGTLEIVDNAVDENCDDVLGIDLDRDRDHVQPPLDCDDGNPAIHRGAYDKPENGIDEDCFRGDAPWPELPTRLAWMARWQPSSTAFRTLELRKVLPNSRVVVTCNGSSCPRRRVTMKKLSAAGKVVKLTPFLRKSLRRGTKLIVTVTAEGHVARVWRFSIGRTGPRVDERCVPPGDTRPETCES